MCVGSGHPRTMSQERIPGECHLLFSSLLSNSSSSGNHEASHVGSLNSRIRNIDGTSRWDISAVQGKKAYEMYMIISENIF